jgi:2-keto-3-deoxy-L-rhamnonate aldolase RhmA
MVELNLKQKMKKKDQLLGTFIRTPSIEIVELLAVSGLDFACLDAEHFAFDRSRLDACLAVGCALGFPLLVRIPNSTEPEILKALDAGAAGIVVPHVDSALKAQEIVKAAHYGAGGRGFAGGTRSSGRLARSMKDIIQSAAEKTIVIVQIEEVSGVDVKGLDAVFIGPSDLSLSYGHTDINSADLVNAMKKVGAAAKAKNLNYITFLSDLTKLSDWKSYGFSTYVLGSEHSWILRGAQQAVKDFSTFK